MRNLHDIGRDLDEARANGDLARADHYLREYYATKDYIAQHAFNPTPMGIPGQLIAPNPGYHATVQLESPKEEKKVEWKGSLNLPYDPDIDNIDDYKWR